MFLPFVIQWLGKESVAIVGLKLCNSVGKGVDKGISHHKALEVNDLVYVLRKNFQGQLRHVVAPIGLRRKEELIGTTFGKLFEKVQNESVVVLGGL
jgi:hypothetical protein